MIRRPRKSTEQRILGDYEDGKYVPVTSPEELERIRGGARATVLKDCRVNIRLSSKVLAGIRARAAEEGLPYQSLIASILHKYVAGRLVDARAGDAAAEQTMSRTKRVKASR